MKKLLINSFLIITMSLLMNCRHKPANSEVEPEPEKGKIKLHLHNYVDINEIDEYGDVYTAEDLRQISVSIAQLYLTDFELEKPDGSFYSVSDTILLKVQDNYYYSIPKVPVGRYKSIRFKVGLDPVTNAKLHSSDPSGVLNRSEMWFGASAQPEGYIFLNFQGKIDTATTPDPEDASVVLQSFSYKIGTNANYVQVKMPKFASDKIVSTNYEEAIHIIIDYKKLLRGVILNLQANLQINTVGENSSAIADTIVKNIPSMFKYE